MVKAAGPELNQWSERLARLFAQAGLISEQELRQFNERHRKLKSMVEVLNQDAFSVDTFRDFFFRAEINPFRKTSSLGGALSRPFALTQPEVAHLLTEWKPELKTTIKWLEACNAVHRGTLGEGARQAELKGDDPYAWLGREGWITPDVIQKFMESPSNPLPRLGALALSIFILEDAAALDSSSEKPLGHKLEWEKTDALEKQLRERIGMRPAELLGKLEEGLSVAEGTSSQMSCDVALAAMFPTEFMKHRQFFPVGRGKWQLDLAMADPLDLSLVVLLKWLTGLWVRPHYVESDAIEETLAMILNGSNGAEFEPMSESKKQQGASKGSMKESKQKNADAEAPEIVEDKTLIAKSPGEKAALPKLRRDATPTDNLSAVQLVSSIVESAIDLSATDIHFEPGRGNMMVRFRLDGQLSKILTIPQNLVGPVTSRLKVLASLDVTERRRPQDGHIALDMEGRHFDFRIATLPSAWGEKIAIRILDSARVMTGLDKSGLSEKQIVVVERMIRHPYGIILVTGPTGSGKTSTLYAALQALNSEDRHLVTIEDPIEYQLDGINQVEVDPTVGLTFSEGLRAILRQDPNVIMVGEIRDPDTALTAIRAAMTGHLVFSTMHTNTAVGAFQALSNMGATPYMIGSAVSGVIAQRLVRKLCLKCKKAGPVPEALVKDLHTKLASGEKWHHAVGCPECLGTGYSGRTGIFEIMEMTDKLRKGVLANDSPDRLLKIASEDGHVSISDAALALVRSGVTSAEEVLKKVILE